MRLFLRMACTVSIALFNGSCEEAFKQPTGRHIVLGCDKSQSNVNENSPNIEKNYGYKLCEELFFQTTKTLRPTIDAFDFFTFDGEGSEFEFSLYKSTYNQKTLKAQFSKSMSFSEQKIQGTATGSFFEDITNKIKDFKGKNLDKDTLVIINSDFFDEPVSNNKKGLKNLDEKILSNFSKLVSESKNDKVVITNFNIQNEKKIKVLSVSLGKSLFIASQNDNRVDDQKEIVHKVLSHFKLGGF